MARYLLVAAGGCTLLLFTVISVLIRAGNGDFGQPASRRGAGAGVRYRLLLLPAVGVLVFIINLLGGLFFYRKDEQRLVAYLLWTSSV